MRFLPPVRRSQIARTKSLPNNPNFSVVNSLLLPEVPTSTPAQSPAPSDLPSPDRPLHFGRSNIGNLERFLDLAREIPDRGWLSNNGPLVQEFERRIAAYIGVKHCICSFSRDVFVNRLFAPLAGQADLRVGGLQGADSVSTRHAPLKPFPDPIPLKIQFPTSN